MLVGNKHVSSTSPLHDWPVSLSRSHIGDVRFESQEVLMHKETAAMAHRPPARQTTEYFIDITVTVVNISRFVIE